MESKFNSERKHSILKARAQKLAELTKEDVEKEDCIEVVEFTLGKERYAIESIYVREVYPLKNLTVLPCVPDFVYGVINVRRKIISLIDLKKVFDLPNQEHTPYSKVVILEKEDMEFAILCDTLIGVTAVPVAKIQTSLPTLTGLKQEFFKGVTTDYLTILDADSLLTSKKLVVNETIEI